VELGQVLGALPPIVDPNVLHGAAARDDAAVYRIAPDRALVATIDFFTPIVDDPFEYGAIAAANALSDVYVVGARPLFALGITAFPRAKLGAGLLEKIVSGGASKLGEAAYRSWAATPSTTRSRSSATRSSVRSIRTGWSATRVRAQATSFS